MLSIIVIFAMAVLALRILWDGRIPVSSNRVASGWAVKLMGFTLFAASPLAYGAVVAFAPARDEADVIFWSTLLGLPAVTAFVAVLAAKPAAPSDS